MWAKVLLTYSLARFNRSRCVISCCEAQAYMQRTMAAILKIVSASELSRISQFGKEQGITL